MPFHFAFPFCHFIVFYSVLRSPSFLLGATLFIPVRHPLLFLAVPYPFKDKIIRSASNTQDRGILLICASSQQYFLLFGVFFLYSPSKKKAQCSVFLLACQWALEWTVSENLHSPSRMFFLRNSQFRAHNFVYISLPICTYTSWNLCPSLFVLSLVYILQCLILNIRCGAKEYKSIRITEKKKLQ